MPCRSDGYEDTPPVTKKEDRIDHLLCEALDLLDDRKKLSDGSDELQKWAKNHRKREEERVRREALAKLTTREKKLLGLK